MYLNKVTLIGNITRDVELKLILSGQKVVSFGLATNRTWKDSNGSKQEAVEYHNIIGFGKQAEVIAQYCSKGSQLFIEGRLQTRTWEDKTTNEKKYKTEIIIENFQFGNKNEVKTEKVEKVKEDTIEYPEDKINAEDIPF